MRKCKSLLSLVLSFLLLFGLFSVNAFASNETNLIDTNMSNWVDYGENSTLYQQADVTYIGNNTNYITVSGSNKVVVLYDITQFLKVGESYEFSFMLPNTEGLNNTALNSCELSWYLCDASNSDFPIAGEEVFRISIDNGNKYNYLGKTTTFEFSYTQGFKNTCLCLSIYPGEGFNSYNYLQLYISNVSLTRIQSEEEGLLTNIIEWLKQIKDNLTNGFNNLITNIIEIPAKIGEALKDLFVPSEDYFETLSNSFKDIAEERFGALFTVVDIIDNFILSFDADKTTEYIDIPVYNFDIMGYPFSFGGWRFRFIPDYDIIKDIVVIVKGFTNVLITFAFIEGLKSRYDEIFGGG